jgi:hypothetical protein
MKLKNETHVQVGGLAFTSSEEALILTAASLAGLLAAEWEKGRQEGYAEGWQAAKKDMEK